MVTPEPVLWLWSVGASNEGLVERAAKALAALVATTLVSVRVVAVQALTSMPSTDVEADLGGGASTLGAGWSWDAETWLDRPVVCGTGCMLVEVDASGRSALATFRASWPR